MCANMFAVPLSEDEQRVLDEIERQLRVNGPRLDDSSRARRLADAPPKQPSSASPVALLVLGCVGGLVSMIAGVLVGGVLGIVIAWCGFAALVIGGVGVVRGSQTLIAEQVQLFAERYSSPNK